MAQVTFTESCYAYISGTWTLLLDVAPISVDRGISDNKPESRLADIGSISLSLNNASGIYTPGTTAGWKRGIPFKMVITYDGTDYIKFRGVIDSISLETKPGEKIVNIIALDWFDFASNIPS